MNKFLVAALLSAVAAVPAFAGEGQGDPFAIRTPGEITTAAPQGFDVGAAAMPVLPPSYSFAFNGVPTTQPSSREAEVLTAGSVPQNAFVGTIQYAQARNAARWFASHPGLQNVAGRAPDIQYGPDYSITR